VIVIGITRKEAPSNTAEAVGRSYCLAVIVWQLLFGMFWKEIVRQGTRSEKLEQASAVQVC